MLVFLKIVFACLSDASNAFFMDLPIMGSIESYVLQKHGISESNNQRGTVCFLPAS